MHPRKDERRQHRRPWAWTGIGPETGSEVQFRKLELLGMANGGIFLAALAVVLLAPPLPPTLFRIVAPLVLLACAITGLLLRRRFWKVLEDELRRRKRAEQEARAADQVKGRFLADVSHEIRTPMNGILGMTEVLLRDEASAERREALAIIRTSAEALLALVTDLLDLSRIEAGRLLLRPRDFPLRELAREVFRLLAPQAATRQVDLRLHIDPALPDELHGDPVRLRQVLLNLVGNAVRFTRQGSVTVTLVPQEEEGRGTVLRCEVRDTGVGIRPEVQVRLFQPFTQSESSASRPLGGIGLGLVISKSLIEQMGGAIGFESARGAGSTFWFRIPLIRALGSGMLMLADAPHVAGESRRQARAGRQVLVVDDRAANRAVAVAQLHGLGYGARAVESGEEALALLAAEPFDAVLLDSEMPGLDGFETCDRLRLQEGEGRRLPVIAVTAHTSPEVKERCLAAGMDDYLAKPFTSSELAARLDRWLGLEPAPAAEPAAETIEERLAALRVLGERTGHDMSEVVTAFLRQGEADLAAVRDALPREDGKTAAAAAHALAGSAGVLGAAELAGAAAEMAALARRGDLIACTARLPELERLFQEVARRLTP